MSANLKSQLDSTVDTYVQYINVDTAATVSSVKKESKLREITEKSKFFQDRKINDEVDTLLRKLDEFEQLLVLSHSDANVCLFKHVPGLQSKLSEMQDVFDKVDRLEFMVAKIKQDMDQLDRQLTQAESTVETSAPGLKSIVPFIFVRNLSKNNVC